MNLVIAIGATLLLGAFYCWTSRINGIFFFGRTVGAGIPRSDAGRAITRRYLVAVATATAGSVVLAWAASHLGRSFAATGVLAEFVAFSVIFARANRQAQRLEREQGGAAATQGNIVQVALLEPPSYRIPGIGAILAPPMAGLACVVVALFFSEHNSGWSGHWEALNASLEMHGGASLVGMGVGMLVAASGLLLLFSRSARLRTTMAQYTVRTSVAMQWIGLALLMTMLGCNAAGVTASRGMTKVLMLAALLAALGTLVWNQSRSKRFVPPPPELGGDHRWRWGLFYLDRADPALFVQSRCGAGYSLNYGRILAWPIALAVWGYFVAMLFVGSPHQ